MTEFKDKFNIKTKSTNVNETMNTQFEKLAKSINKEHDKQDKVSNRGKNLRVTDIVNPTHCYYDIKNPTLDDPEKLKKKFNYGRFIEAKVENILSMDDKFVLSQGNVDGSKCKMSDVKGKIDFRIGDEIIEFKTSEYDIPDVDTLFAKNPQDLEQLILYILFTERSNMEHTLLYITGRYPNLIPREFNVKITKRDDLIDYFKGRYDRLQKAIVDENPEGLGRCRYFSSCCKFNEKQICKCDKENEIDLSVIKNSVRVSIKESGFKDKLNNIKEDYSNSFVLWDIITPRKWVFKNSNPYFYSEWGEDSKEKYDLRKEMERKFIEKELVIKEHVSEEVQEMKEDLFLIDNSFDDNEKGESKNIRHPFLVRVTDSKPPKIKKLNQFYTYQLALACALSNAEMGYCFVFYKEQNIGLLYAVKFGRLGDVKAMAKDTVKLSVKSIQEGALDSELYFCPDFVKKDCPCVDYCDKREEKL